MPNTPAAEGARTKDSARDSSKDGASNGGERAPFVLTSTAANISGGPALPPPAPSITVPISGVNRPNNIHLEAPVAPAAAPAAPSTAAPVAAPNLSTLVLPPAQKAETAKPEAGPAEAARGEQKTEPQQPKPSPVKPEQTTGQQLQSPEDKKVEEALKRCDPAIAKEAVELKETISNLKYNEAYSQAKVLDLHRRLEADLKQHGGNSPDAASFLKHLGVDSKIVVQSGTETEAQRPIAELYRAGLQGGAGRSLSPLEAFSAAIGAKPGNGSGYSYDSGMTDEQKQKILTDNLPKIAEALGSLSPEERQQLKGSHIQYTMSKDAPAVNGADFGLREINLMAKPEEIVKGLRSLMEYEKGAENSASPNHSKYQFNEKLKDVQALLTGERSAITATHDRYMGLPDNPELLSKGAANAEKLTALVKDFVEHEIKTPAERRRFQQLDYQFCENGADITRDICDNFKKGGSNYLRVCMLDPYAAPEKNTEVLRAILNDARDKEQSRMAEAHPNRAKIDAELDRYAMQNPDSGFAKQYSKMAETFPDRSCCSLSYLNNVDLLLSQGSQDLWNRVRPMMPERITGGSFDTLQYKDGRSELIDGAGRVFVKQDGPEWLPQGENKFRTNENNIGITSSSFLDHGREVISLNGKQSSLSALPPDKQIETLAKALDTPEKLHFFMQGMFRYVHDGADPAFYSQKQDYNQTPAETLVRVNGGKLRGDCEDYSTFAKVILEKQGKEPQVVHIPQHATCLWVEKGADGKENGYSICTYNLDRNGVQYNGKNAEEMQRTEGFRDTTSALNSVLAKFAKAGPGNEHPAPLAEYLVQKDTVLTKIVTGPDQAADIKAPVSVFTDSALRSRVENLGTALATHNYGSAVNLTEQLNQFNPDVAASWRGYRAYSLEQTANNDTSDAARQLKRQMAAGEYRKLVDGGVSSVNVPTGVAGEYYVVSPSDRLSSLEVRLAGFHASN